MQYQKGSLRLDNHLRCGQHRLFNVKNVSSFVLAERPSTTTIVVPLGPFPWRQFDHEVIDFVTANPHWFLLFVTQPGCHHMVIRLKQLYNLLPHQIAVVALNRPLAPAETILTGLRHSAQFGSTHIGYWIPDRTCLLPGLGKLVDYFSEEPDLDGIEVSLKADRFTSALTHKIENKIPQGPHLGDKDGAAPARTKFAVYRNSVKVRSSFARAATFEYTKINVSAQPRPEGALSIRKFGSNDGSLLAEWRPRSLQDWCTYCFASIARLRWLLARKRLSAQVDVSLGWTLSISLPSETL